MRDARDDYGGLKPRDDREDYRGTRAQQDPEASELLIYGDIGFSWFDDGTTARDVAEWLDAQPPDAELSVRIASGGGDAFEGVAIYNLLHQDRRRVIVHVDSTACSAASIVAMAGDEIHMAENALMMIHDPWILTMGNAEELRGTADLLDKIAEASLLTTYVRRTGMDPDELRRMMHEETWMDAAECMELGFCTHIDEAKKEPAASLRADHAKRYKHVPEKAAAFMRVDGNDRMSAWQAERGDVLRVAAAAAAFMRVDVKVDKTALDAAVEELVRAHVSPLASATYATKAELQSKYGLTDAEVEEAMRNLDVIPKAIAAPPGDCVCSKWSEPGTEWHNARVQNPACPVHDKDNPPAEERGGRINKESAVDIKEIQAALDTTKAELSAIQAKAAALETQNLALVAERDSANAALATVRDNALRAEVEAMVGVKFAPVELEAQLALAKSDRALFDKLIGQRTPMTLLQRDPIGAGPNPEPKSAAAPDENGAGFAQLVNAAVSG